MSASLHAVLIQVAHATLLLPNAAVAEVVTLDRFEPPDDKAPAWLAGWHSTAERRVPVLLFEVLQGGPRPEPNRRARIVIVHPLSSATHVGHYAILAQGQPHLIGLERTGVEAVENPQASADDLVLSQVRIGGQDALIPDLEELERRLAGLA